MLDDLNLEENNTFLLYVKYDPFMSWIFLERISPFGHHFDRLKVFPVCVIASRVG